MSGIWYERRNELRSGMVFTDFQNERVMLDRRVPGDGSRWYVADWWNGSWSFMDSTIEPGDLTELVADNLSDGSCRHCGRDNLGYEADRCADDCPIFDVSPEESLRSASAPSSVKER